MLKKFILTVALIFPLVVMAQEASNVVVGPRTSQQRDAEKKQAKLKKKAQKEQDKGIKQRFKMQDKATRKRMKKSRKEADRVNNNKRKKKFLFF
jgi:hypothetical protein